MANTSVVRVRGASSAPFREFRLDLFQEILPRKVFREVARRTLPEGRRNRTLVPEAVIWLMGIAALNVLSMNAALEQGRHLLRRRFPRRCTSVTAQAWEKARRRLPLAYFRMLFEHLATRFFENFDPVIRWKGFRVLAGDGSCLSIPESSGVRKAFGGPSNQRPGQGPIQARLTGLVSVFTGACLDFALGPYTTSEIHLLLQMFSHLRLQDLVILDRGFFGFGLLWKIRQTAAHFLVRAQGTTRPRKIRRLGPNDWLCEFRVSWDARRKWPGVPRTLVFRMIRTQIHRLVKAEAANFILATPAAQRKLYDLLLETIATYTVLQRPGRSFPRSSGRARYAARRRKKHQRSGRHGC